jgi:hypothetical protein
VTEAHSIKLQALVTAEEQRIVDRAARMVAGCLTAVSEAPWTIEYAYPRGIGELDLSAPSLIITSFLQEAERIHEDWAASEARLRQFYRDLCLDAERSVYVCTVLRHVAPAAPRREERLVRIRRLNLLAAVLSYELGVLVADLDRDLADIGARNLQTDYRLQGPYATASAAKSLALTMLLAGLDYAVPFETQEKARAVLKAVETPLAVRRRYAIGAPVKRVRDGNVVQAVIR